MASKKTAHEHVLSITEYILDACIIEQDQSNLGNFETGKQILFISRNELPLDESKDRVNQMKLLINQRAEREINGIKYCIGLYHRCFNLPTSSNWNKQIWNNISNIAHLAVARSIVKILIDAASNQSRDDLFSVYSKELSGGDIDRFVSYVSGWTSDNIPLALLQSILKHAHSTIDGQNAIIHILQSTMNNIKSMRIDEILTKGSQLFDALQHLFNDEYVLETVGQKLLVETKDSVQNLGSYFERQSVFGSLLSISTIIDKINPALLHNVQYSCYTSLNGFPKPFTSDLNQLNSSIQDTTHKCISLFHSAILQLLKRPSTKNNVLSWFAAVVSCNEMRAGPKYEIKKGHQGTASDGFLVNYCMLMLSFCRPFFSYHSSAPKLPLIVPQYPSSDNCRLDLHNEPCFANGLITVPDRLSKGYERFLCSDGNYKFVTECFFITSRSLHIGLLPVTDTFLNNLSDLAKEIDRRGNQDKILSDLNALYLYSGDCSLLDPQLVQYCSEFYITSAVWLTMLMESCHKDHLPEHEIHIQQCKLFSRIPEHIVKDMVRWFLFVLRTKPKLLHGLQLTPFIDCCISLLERSDLLPGPVAQSQIISVLLACVGRDNTQRLLTTDTWGGIHGDLSAIVQGSPSFQARLGPALLHTYSAVGVVEGLDVDRENFDKYAARYDIAQLLLYLWSRIDCRESIIRQCNSKQFILFLQAIFDTLLYQLNDGFTRIANIQKMEVDKTNESFLTREQRAAKALINMGTKLLNLLELITEVESISKHFISLPLSIRASSAIMGFLDILCGARQSELKVKEPEKIGFDPRKIVSQIATIIYHIWAIERKYDLSENGFIHSLVDHPDYNISALSKVYSVLERHQLCGREVISEYKNFIEQLQKLTGGPGDPLAQASAIVGNTTAVDNIVADWQTDIEAITICKDDIIEMYRGALNDVVYDSVTLQGVHSLEDKTTETVLDPRSPRLRAILKDVKQLQESLIVHPDSSIFVKQDEDRMDLVRVLITGPVDTPYNYGCFIFDIYYPANYPVNPPLVLLTTTGNGTIRFNPNLYADGKVCLSLLGTWHGGDSSEKWDPLKSNLMQVLISIQGLILIPEPIYNEPGYEAMQGTPQGKLRSAQYNAYVQINTVRYAMLEQLKHPPVGFEDIIRIHFMLLKDSILNQCSKWLRNTVSVDHQLKLRKAVDQLRIEFDKL